MNWILEQTGFDKHTIADRGNRFLIGNGYLGVRGTLDEDGKNELAAVNLAGIYDQVDGGWREPLNAPNPFHTICLAQGRSLGCTGLMPQQHCQSLDYFQGLARRKTVWSCGQACVQVESERFVSLTKIHLSGSRYTVTVRHAPCSVELRAHIDGDVWDLNGPHYSSTRYAHTGTVLLCCAKTAGGAEVAVARRLFWPQAEMKIAKGENFQSGTLLLQPGQSVTLVSMNAVYTTNDTPDPAAAALAAVQELTLNAYEALCAENACAWQKIWKAAQVEIDGDEQAEQAINYSLYHLHSIAPAPGMTCSIPARGLSGQTYKGAVFWDTEMFMLDHFLYTRPQVARSLLCYRIESLPAAMEKARYYGWQGAFYAWESQDGGYDACSDYNVIDVFTGRPVRTYFKDKQVHISAAVARGILLYTHVTGDKTLLAEGGAKVIAECARFYWSLLVRPNATGCLELHDVIGPDEYHERVNNNAYTNRMAAAVFDWAAQAAALLQDFDPLAYQQLCDEMKLESLLSKLAVARQEIYLPKPDPTGLIEQFDGYFSLEDPSIEEVRARLKDPREYWGGSHGVAGDTQIIKQADVVAMLGLFAGEYTAEQLRRNWQYYETRTEHGSSLSACMYALVACRFGDAQAAYPFFMQSATAELRGGGKQWAGLVYIGGTHPAAAGGAWKVLAEGFAGLRCGAQRPQVTPCLPAGWKRVAFSVIIQGKRWHIEITPEQVQLISMESE